MINNSNKACRLLAPLLLFAAAFLATAQDQAQATEAPAEDPVVLQAGDHQETLSELDARFEIAIRGLAASEGLELTEEIRAQLETFRPSYLEQRATEVALIQEAERRGLEVSEEAVDERVAQVRGTLPEGQEFAVLLEQAGFQSEEQLRELVRETAQIQLAVDAVEAEIEVSGEDIQQYYDANEELFARPEQVCARHILVETVEEAQEIAGELEAGGDFATLATERSIDPGGQGGDLGCFGRGRMVPPFEEAAFAAEVGVPAGPVESQFGQHLILVYERTEAGAVPLEDVREQVETQVRRDRLGSAIDELRQGADITLYPERLGVGSGAAPTEEPVEAPAEGQ
jgi:parvulin-like peptidyl-prolyl isomerase